MEKKLIKTIGILHLLFSVNSFASTNIVISSNIIQPTCKIDVPSNVSVGKIGKDKITPLGPTGNENLTYAAQFDVKITDCAENVNGLSLKTSGPFKNLMFLQNQGTAKDVYFILEAKNNATNLGYLFSEQENVPIDLTNGYAEFNTKVYVLSLEKKVTVGSIDTFIQLSVQYN